LRTLEEIIARVRVGGDTAVCSEVGAGIAVLGMMVMEMAQRLVVQ
jgi:hypothetical protein